MPKKSLGQNFLNNENILNRIVDCGHISNKDVVLEIGPGTGNLTKKIIEKNPNHLIVIEKDKDLANSLKKKYGKYIEVVNKDILDCYNDFTNSRSIKVFGNLPYNISTKILTSYIKIENLHKKFENFIFIFQKEVADRILANENSKEYGRLSILTSWKMMKMKIMDINPKNFFPIPKVWSSILTLTPKERYQNLKKIKNLEHVTNIFFNQRRKMIKKPMKQLFCEFEQVAKQLNIDLNLRPQNLSKDKYIEICKLYENLN